MARDGGIVLISAGQAPVSTYAPGWQKWTAPVTIMVATLLSYIDRQTLAVLSPTILKDTGLTASLYTDALTAFQIFYMIGNPLWGSAIDYLGLRIGMLAAVLVWTLASVSHAWVFGFIGFAMARAVLGFGEGGAFPGVMRTATDALPPNRQARGIALGYSGASLGAIVTPLVVTPIALKFGWRSAFLVTGGLGALWLVVWYFVARPPFLPAVRRFAAEIHLAEFAGAARLGGDLQLRLGRRSPGSGRIFESSLFEPSNGP